LREIYYNWHGTTWFIEGDISQCFDKLDHDLLLKTLSENIHDGRFIKLLQELLDAGYLEEWTFHRTLSGVPQGGIVSPILSNILLDKLDQFVENVLIPRYTRGAKRKPNPEYRSLMERSRRQRRKGNVEQAEGLRREAQTLPSQLMDDPGYRRLKYVRYADDFLLGFIGPRSEAEEIKQALGVFLREELKLELSEEKTLLTHARSRSARFLGYGITVQHEDTKRCRLVTGPDRRNINGQIGLQVPPDVIKAKCATYRRGLKVTHRAELENESDYAIVVAYQLEFRGIANYYRLAYNMHTLRKLKWVMEISLTKTLAHKFKVSVPKIYEKYGAKCRMTRKDRQNCRVKPGIQYATLRTPLPRVQAREEDRKGATLYGTSDHSLPETKRLE
jgi:hypothetical protein